MIFELLLLHVLLTTSMTNILLVYFCMHKFILCAECMRGLWSEGGVEIRTNPASFLLQVLRTFQDVVWHASWSLTGDILAISGGDNKVGYNAPL